MITCREFLRALPARDILARRNQRGYIVASLCEEDCARRLVEMRCLILLPMLVALASAQEFRGIFGGRVTDQEGAGAPKEKVTATETRTGAVSTAYSETSGAYTIPFLALGHYEIAAEAPGFKKFVRKGLTLSAG